MKYSVGNALMAMSKVKIEEDHVTVRINGCKHTMGRRAACELALELLTLLGSDLLEKGVWVRDKE